MVEQIQVQAAKNKINDKEDLHNGLRRNDFLMPALKTRICTVEFMVQVLKREVWVPKASEVTHHPCAEPPKR